MRMNKKLSMIMFYAILTGVNSLPIHSEDSEPVSVCSAEANLAIQQFFQEPKNSIDVLVLGDSNVYRGFSPLMLWKEKKVASYALASPLQAPWLSYHLLVEALNYQKPRILLFEINELFANPIGKKERACKVLNAMPTNLTRLRAIRNSEGTFSEADEDKLFEVHTRSFYRRTMHQLTGNIEKPSNRTHYKGYYLNVAVDPIKPENIDYMNRQLANVQINESSKRYMDKMIELCRQQNIKLIFVKFPTKQWTYQKDTLARAFAAEKAIPYLDMNTEMSREVLDWNHDTKDKGNHLNDYGAIKTTRELGEFLQQKYSIKATNSMSVQKSYDAALTMYEQKRSIMIKNNITEDAQ